MTDQTKEPTEAKFDDADGHGASISVENLHFNIIAVAQEAQKRFKDQTGKDAKFFYAPEALMYLLDGAVKSRAVAAGQKVPRSSAVVNLLGMELIVTPGTCITLTAEPLHYFGEVPPTIMVDAPERVQ